MKLSLTCILLVCCSCVVAQAQLQIVPAKDAPGVFAGAARKITVTFHNSGGESIETPLSTQLYQATSATAAPVGQPVDWKKLQVLPGQTVLESISLDFPAVKAETKFIVQWQTDASHILGTTEVRVYPTNLLSSLKTLAGENGPGVFDPQNQLKPLLKNLNVDFQDLEDSGLDHFSGRLAIIGPFQSSSQMREGLTGQLKELARKNTGVVWIQPPQGKKAKLLPSFYSVMENTNAIVVVQADLVSGLSESPQAQLNLLSFCRQALNPQPLALPDTSTRP